MKNGRTIQNVFITSLFTLSLIGCGTTRTNWGDWNSWGRFEQTGISQSQTATINSRPSGAQVYVDGSLAGETPTTINLTYPVLRAERTKTQYEQKVPGVLEHVLLAQQTTTSTVSTQREEQLTTSTKTHTIEVTKQGYFPERTTVTVPGNNNLELVLKERPVFAIKTFAVKNNFHLTVPERLYEFLYGRKYSIDSSKFDRVKGMAFASEAFENPLGKDPDYYIGGEVDIQRGNTEINIFLTDRYGRTITTRRTSIETKNPDSLIPKVEGIIQAITDTYVR